MLTPWEVANYGNCSVKAFTEQERREMVREAAERDRELRLMIRADRPRSAKGTRLSSGCILYRLAVKDA